MGAETFSKADAVALLDLLERNGIRLVDGEAILRLRMKGKGNRRVTVKCMPVPEGIDNRRRSE